MPKAIIFTGVPACGKTSYYKEFFGEYVHINLDTLKTRNKEKSCLRSALTPAATLLLTTQTRPPRTEQDIFSR